MRASAPARPSSLLPPHAPAALAALAAVAAALAAVPAEAQAALPPQRLPQLMEPRGVMSLPQARPARTISFGDHPSQVVELFLPAQRPEGRLPVVVMLHGGCFRSDLPGRELMRAAAAAFTGRGWAVWSVGYRRVDEEGGGYPGTFLDVARGIDLLRAHAAEEGLDPGRVAAFGHSVGGTLALWAAGRRNIRPTSPLHMPDPLALGGVVSVGGFGDLRTFGPVIAVACGRETLPALLAERPAAPAAAPPPGPASAGAGQDGLQEAVPPPAPAGAERPEDDAAPPAATPRADPFADTSPAALLPARVPVVMLHGVYDHVAFPAVGLLHAQVARRTGDRAEIYVAPNAGHFEVIAPGHSAFAQALAALERFLQ